MQSERRNTMKCQKCGFESQQDFVFCNVCGTRAHVVGPFENKVMSILRSAPFLAICILMTVSTVSALFSGAIPVFQVLYTLYTIFFWIARTKACEGRVDVGSLRGVSGTYFATYVIYYVVAGCFILVAVALAIVLALTGTSFEILQAYMDALKINLNGFPVFPTASMAVAIGWVMAAFIMFMGALVLVINIFVTRRMHGFVKSIYKSVEDCGTTPIVNANLTKIWLWIDGILSALTAICNLVSLNMMAALANGSEAAIYIIGAVLIEKHFIKQDTPEVVYQAPNVEE